MSKLHHDRVPDGSLIRGSAPGQKSLSAVKSVLLIRLWSSNQSGAPDTSPGETATVPASLTLDLISASGGVPEKPRGNVLSATFSDIPTAILTARRLQWTLQGLQESAGFEGTGAAVLVHSVEDPCTCDGSLPMMLEEAGQGQILLTGSISEFVNDLPGMPLREASENGWREMMWRPPEMTGGYVADEQAVLRLILELGRVDPSPPKPKPPLAQPAQEPIHLKAPDSPSLALPDDLIRPRIDREGTGERGGRRWLIVGGVAAALVLAVALSVVGFHRKVAVQPAKVAPTPAISATPAPPREVKQAAPQKHAHLPPQPQLSPNAAKPSLNVQKPGAETCDFTQADIERSLGRAENYMHAGRLSDAQVAFQSVANCPSAREKALEGLQRVRQKKETQGPSSTP